MRISDWSSDVCSSDLYRSELAELAAKGADTLVLIDYGDGAGMTILRQALENGFFSKFVGGDGMKTDALIDALGAENLAEFTTSAPIGAESAGLDVFNELFTAAGGDQTAVQATTRSSEHRGGKECVSTCTYRWWQYH